MDVQVSGFMGVLYTITDWVMRLFILNMLWIVTNLPILFILFLMVLTPSQSAIILLAIPLAFLLPLLFFTGTTAAFATVRDWILKNDQSSLLKAYWGYLKVNYKKGLLSGIALTFLWIIWLIDYYYFRSLSDLLGVMLIIIGLLLFAYTIIFLCLSVHYHMRLKELFQNAFFVTVGSPLLLVGILVVNFTLLFMSIRFLFLLPFFTISMSIFLSFFAFYRFTLKVGKKG
jgi:uncharacterized membrane protein YesL